MIDLDRLEVWLTKINARYRVDEVPPRSRPFIALRDFSREFNCAVSLDSSVAKIISDWFQEHSPPDTHAVGPLFTGAFYFDASFWPLYIPIGYGTFSLNALDCLETMPQSIREHLSQSQQDFWSLSLYWADCCDYGYGVDDIIKQDKLNQKALALIKNGDRELAGAISLLVSPRPNTRTILALRMACEIFLKTYLVQERNLTDQQLKKLSHRIEDIAAECFEVTRAPEFNAIGKSKMCSRMCRIAMTGWNRSCPKSGTHFA